MTKATAFTPWEDVGYLQMYLALPSVTRKYIRELWFGGSRVWTLVLVDEFRLEQEQFLDEYSNYMEETLHDNYGDISWL